MMRLARWGLMAAGAVGVARWAASRGADRMGDAEPHNRWLKVTVACPPERLSQPDGLPDPVARLTDRAEVSVRPAPGGRGTELGLRLYDQPPTGLAGTAARLSGHDPRQELRRALRDAKSIIETGEVIRPDRPSTTHDTLTGKPLEYAINRAGGEGRL